ncbi:MAG: hypothetical protein V1777_00305 [Candidatus Micrarchaeota archaeon]
MKKTILLVLMVLLAGSALAIFAEVPREVVLQGQNTAFPITITNTLNTSQALSLRFFSPNNVSINAPATIEPNQSITLLATADNPFFLQNTVYKSRLTIKIGNEQSIHQIRFVFPKTRQEDQNNPNPPANDQNSIGFTGFLLANGSAAWNKLSAWGTTGLSWTINTKVITTPVTISILQLFLIGLVAILAVAFFVRVYHYAKSGEKK